MNQARTFCNAPRSPCSPDGIEPFPATAPRGAQEVLAPSGLGVPLSQRKPEPQELSRGHGDGDGDIAVMAAGDQPPCAPQG